MLYKATTQGKQASKQGEEAIVVVPFKKEDFDPSQMANEMNEVRARYNLGLIDKWELDVQLKSIEVWYLQEEYA